MAKMEESLFPEMNFEGNIIASKFSTAAFSHNHSPSQTLASVLLRAN